MKHPSVVTINDFPDWSSAFDGEASYPLPRRLREPLLVASCWSAWFASAGEAPSANPKDIARLAARSLADIDGTPAEEVISGASGFALLVLTHGATGWLSSLVTKELYYALKDCQAAEAGGRAELDAWVRVLVLAHAVGAAEARA